MKSDTRYILRYFDKGTTQIVMRETKYGIKHAIRKAVNNVYGSFEYMIIRTIKEDKDTITYNINCDSVQRNYTIYKLDRHLCEQLGY